ncbi:hypothetical protein [Actinoplanes sp. NPDC051859]|uniref:hypothetical protein n=1 Tax=Actinoplanes sp. NPDC051859 TaxID=3363909 RepID=UPI0037954E61
MTHPNTHPEIVVQPMDAEVLAGLRTLTARVQYACDRQPRPVTTAGVRAWLDAYGYPTKTDTKDQRTYVSRVVNDWRREHGLSDTADQVALTPERLAELDEIAARTAEPTPAPEPVETPAQQPSELVEDSAMADPEPAAPASKPDSDKARGTGPFYAVALVASLISLDTGFRFFGEKMGITADIERYALCGIVELTLIACGYAMRQSARRTTTPGPAQLVAIAFCGVAAFMAINLGGPVAGTVRAALGPVLALVALHLALGIEVHVRHGEGTGALARVRRELRERMLSRLGLADDGRPALVRTRDRAADRAARLAAAKRAPFRRARLARAIRASHVALDTRQRDRMLAQVAAQRSVDDLVNLPVTSPWRP